MVESVAYHKPRRLAVHAAVAGIVAALLGLAVAGSHDLPSWAMIGALAPLTIALAMSERTRRGAPSGSWSPAHRVTLFRAVLIGGVAVCAWSPVGAVEPFLVVSGAAVAFALDGVDGWLARRTDTASDYGARLDMELDAAFVVVLSALAWAWDRAGSWVMLCGAARYLWWIAEQVVPWFSRPLFPSSHRRHGCFIAVLALILCLWPWSVTSWSLGLAILATLTLTLSFGVDAVWLIQHRGDPR